MKLIHSQNITQIDECSFRKIDETTESFSLRKWFTVSSLLLVTIICSYFALPTIKTIVGSPIGWNEWSSQGQSFQDATTLGIVLNAGRAGLGGGTLGMSEIVISTYNYIQDSDADTFQQHLGGVSMGNLMGAAGAKLTTLKPNTTTKPYLEICTEQQNKIPANIRNCFLAGTLVSKYSETEINNVELVPIEKIVFGDKVWSFNLSKLQWEIEPVLNTFRIHYDGDIATINIGDDIIRSTGGHPFWVIEGTDLENRPLCDCLPVCDQKITPDGRWVYARDLQIGDVVRSRSFGTQKISALELSLTETLVYNFLVDDLHNYAVGENEILIHNTNSPKTAADLPDNISINARRTPKNVAEAEALERIKSNPALGTSVGIKLKDPYFATDVWYKMKYKVGNIEIHYVYEIFERIAKDFKFKNP